MREEFFAVPFGAFGERVTIRRDPFIQWPGKSIRFGHERQDTDRELFRLDSVEAKRLYESLGLILALIHDDE